jgi:hypothetical protein
MQSFVFTSVADFFPLAFPASLLAEVGVAKFG